MNRVAIISVVSVFLTGCMSYWAFPPGKTQVDFNGDQQHCYWTAFSMSDCLQGKGYREIAHDEHLRINQAALRNLEEQKRNLEELRKPVDIVAYDVRAAEMFIGKAATYPPGALSSATTGSIKSSITVEGVTSTLNCTGYSEITKLVPGGKGSFGVGELLCKDGRKIKAEFVFESLRGGFGRGMDSDKNSYLFIFGDLDVTPESLRTKFKKLLEEEKARKSEKKT